MSISAASDSEGRSIAPKIPAIGPTKQATAHTLPALSAPPRKSCVRYPVARAGKTKATGGGPCCCTAKEPTHSKDTEMASRISGMPTTAAPLPELVLPSRLGSAWRNWPGRLGSHSTTSTERHRQQPVEARA